MLRMEQEAADSGSGPDVDALVRLRIRSLRQDKGWSLDALARRSNLSPSNLSRIETGQRRIALDQLVPIARALGVSLDQLVESASDDDVVIRPTATEHPGMTLWLLSREPAPGGVVVAKMRFTPDRTPQPGDQRVHPGREWFTVLTGTVELHLGERKLLVPEGHAAEFQTMTPHAMYAYGGEATELLTIFEKGGESSHIEG